MLRDLSIQNLVLMESCTLSFDQGLTALTGETGSGKTAILQSLKLLLGQKLDTSLIRFGEKKGFIQARFEVREGPCLEILAKAGIPMEDSNLILTREVFIEGKSKSFVNDRMVSLGLLQTLGSHLVQIVDQSSHQELKYPDSQRELLDLFGALQNTLSSFQTSFLELKEAKALVQQMEERKRQKEREFDFCLAQKKELESLSLQEGEEELLFQEHARFCKAQEVSEKTDLIFDHVQNDKRSILSSLAYCRQLCQSLTPIDASFEESSLLIEQATLSLQELLSLLRKTLSSFDIDPYALSELEQKLCAIDKMKKKYGPSCSAWATYKNELAEKIAGFESVEEDLERLQEKIARAEMHSALQAKELSSERKKAAALLEKKLKKELSGLNMAHAQVEILLEKQPISSSGEDLVTFCLSAGIGEAVGAIKDMASGGELARLLLAIKLCLAEKNSTPTLIFDEIDANVGGETAQLIGEKLLALSSYRQVICITHFPQVACQAITHFCIQKQTVSERTISLTCKLDEKGRQLELIRMLGGTASQKTLSTL
jgi:DNA repair protein RecN (Recombination protein N)